MARYVRGEGPVPARVMLLGEGPGKVEDQFGRPFAGPSGDELNLYLARGGIPRKSCYVTNVVKYRVPNDKDPSEKDIARDLYDLYDEFERVQPEIVCTVGRISTHLVLGEEVDMDSVHGLAILSEWCGRQITVVPSYHPAAGLHQPQLAARSDWDFRVLGEVVRGNIKPKPLIWDEYPAPFYALADWTDLRFLPGRVPYPPRVYVDTEGVPGHPYTVQLTFAPGVAYIFRAGDPRIKKLFQELRRQGIKIVMHNSLYDLWILYEMGVELEPGDFEDTILKAYVAQLFPRGLKGLALRFAGMRMQEFPELIRPYDDKFMEEYLFKILAKCGPDFPLPDKVLELKPDGSPHVRQPQHITMYIQKRLKKETKDCKESHRAWWNNLEDVVRQPVIEFLEEPARFTLDMVPWDKVQYYAGRDSDATCRVEPHLDRFMDDYDLWGAYETDLAAVPLFQRMQLVGMKINAPGLMRIKSQAQDKMEEARRAICKLAGLTWFNPNSAPQTRALLNRLGLHTKFVTDSGLESTNDKALNSLYGQHPVIEHILDYREYATIDSRFTDVLVDAARADGRIHPNWRLTEVVSGRPSCTDPNLLAIPVRSFMGKEVRGEFVAEDGYVIIGADLNQIEMRYMAHLSGDKKLCQAYIDGRDIHADTAASMFGVPVEQVDPDLQREPAKRVSFGIITGITGYGLYDQFLLNRITAFSVDDLEEFRQRWFRIYPGVRAFILDCYAEGRDYGYVKDQGGRIRFLPGLYSRNSRVRAEAERATHSHKIQGGAAWLMKRIMARLYARMKEWWRQGIKVEPLLQVYDELELEVEAKYAEMVRAELVQIMEADSAILRVPIKAKAKIGHSWKEVK